MDETLLYPPYRREDNPFPARPNRAPAKPHLVNLHGDEVYDALKRDKKTGVVQEYRTLASALSYLYDAKEFLSENVLSLVDQDEEAAEDLQIFYRSLEGVFTMLNNRFAFVSARALAGTQDPDLVAFLQSKVYGTLGGLEVTSSAVNTWIAEFETAKTSATLRERAKRSAGDKSASSSESSTSKRDKKTLGKKKPSPTAE